MYCSSCGSAAPPGLSYCNRCGADLRSKENEVPKRSGPSPNFLVGGIVTVTTFGLFLVIMLMGVMSNVLHSPDGLINGFAAVAFLSVLLVDALFAWLLLRSKKSPRENTDIVQLKEAIRAELHAAQTAGLAQPAGSVTDHTTRTLEPVPRSSKN
jgi:cytochrome bd-type quinol oxidase subunit 2